MKVSCRWRWRAMPPARFSRWTIWRACAHWAFAVRHWHRSPRWHAWPSSAAAMPHAMPGACAAKAVRRCPWSRRHTPVAPRWKCPTCISIPRRDASSSRPRAPNTPTAMTCWHARRWRARMLASACATTPASPGTTARPNCRAAWQRCWVKPSAPARARWTKAGRCCACMAWPGRRRYPRADVTVSSFLSMAASCVTSCSVMPCERAIAI